MTYTTSPITSWCSQHFCSCNVVRERRRDERRGGESKEGEGREGGGRREIGGGGFIGVNCQPSPRMH